MEVSLLKKKRDPKCLSSEVEQFLTSFYQAPEADTLARLSLNY